MTVDQVVTVDGLLQYDLIASWAHHGDCIGADVDFHRLARLNGLKVHGHPPINPSKRAWCEFDEIEEEKEYIDRNHDIVRAVDFMIACPQGFKEELRSGTWATIRYFKGTGCPGKIVWPDGSVKDVLS